MKITKRRLRRIVREQVEEWGGSSTQPPEKNMTGSEIRALVKRGDMLTSKYDMQLPRYPGGGRSPYVQVLKGEQYTVSAIGSGAGPDEVIAFGPGGKDISIPPWHVHNFDVSSWSGVQGDRSHMEI